MKSKRMWLFFAILSAVFAAATAILAKIGIEGVDSNLAITIKKQLNIAYSADNEENYSNRQNK